MPRLSTLVKHAIEIPASSAVSAPSCLCRHSNSQRPHKSIHFIPRCVWRNSPYALRAFNSGRDTMHTVRVRRSLRAPVAWRLDIDDFLVIYKTYVRPLLEKCMQASSSYLQKNIHCLESVQRVATKLVPFLRNLSYEKRLQALRLTSPYDRRLREDLIETYKILSGFERSQVIPIAVQWLSYKRTQHEALSSEVKLDTRKYFFQSTCCPALDKSATKRHTPCPPKKLSRFVFVRTSSNFHQFR